MNVEAISLNIETPDTVVTFNGTGINPVGSYLNSTTGVFVAEAIDVGLLGASTLDFGACVASPGSATFWTFFNDDATPLYKYFSWRGKLTLANGQGIDWNFSTLNTMAAWGLTIGGHWVPGYRPNI